MGRFGVYSITRVAPFVLWYYWPNRAKAAPQTIPKSMINRSIEFSFRST